MPHASVIKFLSTNRSKYRALVCRIFYLYRNFIVSPSIFEVGTAVQLDSRVTSDQGLFVTVWPITLCIFLVNCFAYWMTGVPLGTGSGAARRGDRNFVCILVQLVNFSNVVSLFVTIIQFCY